MITKIIALFLMAVFYICYFAKILRQKQQGIHTDQLGKGKEGFEKFIEITLKLATYILPLLQVVSIMLYTKEPDWILQIAGLIIEFVGVLIFIMSVAEMKENWRAGVQRDEKTDLVTTGIYSLSRNPAFLGFILMYIGILISFFYFYLFVATLITVILFHLQIVNVEEKFLIEAFGDDYRQYQSKTCRYFGRNSCFRNRTD